jgi:hypothetical protein
MNLVFCNKCNEEHTENMFYKCNNKSLLATGEYKIYTVLRCKKHINEQQKEYINENKEKILERKKDYYNKNKEASNQRAKIYREQNSEQLKIKKNKYHHENKEKINLEKKNRAKTFDGFLTKILGTCRSIDNYKEFEKSCDLDKNFLIELKELQNNLCYFCKNELLFEANSEKLNQASIDRIDNNFGHTKDNVKLTCIFCNHAKNLNNNETYKLFINWVINKIEIKKENYLFNKHYLSQLQGSCRSCDKNKFIENDDNKIINKTEIKELIEKQNNKCAITGLPLIPCSIKGFPLKPSVDRLDNSKGHIKENCQIVCLAIQHGKLTYDSEKVIDYIESIRKNTNIIIN